MTIQNLVLVLGANGQLGNNLLRLLLSRGFRVCASLRISSIDALDYMHVPTRANNEYNLDRRDTYYNSKNGGENLA
jgi:nucleoside-diphosphate-sugar epimerase